MDKLRTIGWAIIRRWTGVTGGILNLFVLLVLLNILDYQTTHILVRLTDFSVEANPMLRFAMEQSGSAYSILWIKAALLGIASVVFYGSLQHAKRKGRLLQIKRLMNVSLFGACVLYSSIVIHNTYGIYLLLS